MSSVYGTYDGWTLRPEMVKCKKKNCTKCPHGPFWYGYRRENGKLKKTYFGICKPGGETVSAESELGKEEQKPHAGTIDPTDMIYLAPSKQLALSMLGIEDESPSYVTIKLAYSHIAARLAKLPNEGGQMLKRVDAAFDYLVRLYRR